MEEQRLKSAVEAADARYAAAIAALREAIRLASLGETSDRQRAIDAVVEARAESQAAVDAYLAHLIDLVRTGKF